MLKKYWLRDRFVSARNVPKRHKYLLETPKHVREQAVFDLYEAYASNFAKRRKDPDHRFRIKFRSRKDNQAILIPKANVSLDGLRLRVFPTMMKGTVSIKKRSIPVINGIAHDCRLALDRLGHFYLCVPTTKAAPPAAEDPTTDLSRVVALDPGVRTFQTGYCPANGVAFKVADKEGARLFRLMLCLDRLISRTALRRGNVSRMRKAQERLRQRIRHLVGEVHWKTIKYLLDRFDIIVIPPFETSRMSARATRILTSKTVRSMTTWAHYTFRTRLQHVATHRGKAVHVLGEEYTTKTCGCCGWLHPKVGGAKVFSCGQCHARMDRDGQAARNILLKSLSHVLATHALE